MKSNFSHPNGFDNFQIHAGLAFLALSVLLIFGQLLSIGHRWGEYPLFYQMNPDFSFQDWLRVYNPMRGGGYRPTAFNLYFQIVSRFLGWQNFPAFQWISFLFQFFLGTCTWIFARKILKFDNSCSFFAGLFVSIHPVFYMLPVHLIHFDALYQVFLLLASVIWISNSRFSLPNAIAFLGLSFLSLTSKEQAVALPCFLFWVLFYDRCIGKLDGGPIFSLKYLCLFLISVFAALIVVSAILYSSGGDDTYRTGIDIPIILNNTLAGFFWIFRVHIFDAPTWPNVRANLYYPAGLILGILMFFFACYYIKTAIFASRERRNLWILIGLIGIFFLLPVYSGGRQWHFGISAIGAMLLSARGFTIILSDIPKVVRQYVPHVMLIFLVTCSAYEVHRDQIRGEGTTRILKQAMEYPPVTSEQLPQNADILYACGSPEALWAFGNESLFQFAFQRRDLKEHAVPSLYKINVAVLNELSSLDNLFVFDYRPGRNPSWIDISSIAKPFIRHMLRGEEVAPVDSLDLRDPTASEFASLKGWSGAEPSGRWTSEKVASLKLALSPFSQGKAILSIKMAGYVNKIHPSIVAHVYLNGILADNLILTYPQGAQISDYTIAIPNEALSGSPIDIRFQINSPARPVDVSPSQDTRQLGLYVQRIDILKE